MASKNYTIYLILLGILLNLFVHRLTANALLHQKQRCPRMCTCTYVGVNMANCSDQNLVNANIGMSSLVEHLDLSNNDIAMIDNDCFKDLRYLKTLLLNHNSIAFIELDAFSSLTALRSVNLTSNRLERFDNQIFEQNSQILSVDLSDNNFMYLENRPIIRSLSLEVLSLHKSKLTHLHVNYFEELPNIKSIDLSENLLIVLNIVAFTMNNNLRSVNVRGNRIKCDEHSEKSIIWLKKNHIEVAIDNCNKKPITDPILQKNERMQMLPSKYTTYSTNVKSNDTLTDDLTSVWHTYDQHSYNIPILNENCHANETTVKNACRLFEICVANFTMLVDEVETKFLNNRANTKLQPDSDRMHHSWYDFVTVQVAFYGGLFLGTMFGAIILFTLKLISDCFTSPQMKNERRVRRKRRNHQFHTTDIRNTNDDNEIVLDNDEPQSIRSIYVQRGEIPREIHHAEQRRSRQSNGSFFAIFYERPIRHRYYKQFNRSATNLVRRLSQSRLFLNSSAINRNNVRRNRQESSNINTEPELESMHAESNQIEHIEFLDDINTNVSETVFPMHSSVLSLNITTDNENQNENQLNAIRAVASESDVFESCERSDTPPPPYNTIAKI